MTAVMPGPPVSRSGRVAAVDWSGRAVGSERFIWIAIAEEGRLASLECGRDRGALAVPAAESERWLRECPPPFWGRLGRRRGPEEQHRRTERMVALRGKPIFQVGGSGTVGTGSLRGFAVLARLRGEGFRIWPFDDPGTPMAVEIFPRLLTGPVVKSRAAERGPVLRREGRIWAPPIP